MTLLDVIAKLEEFKETETIYLREPWTAKSVAVVAIEPDGGGLPPQAKEQGLDYFIEVSIAREFLRDWVSSFPALASSNEQCARLIQFAINDA